MSLLEKEHSALGPRTQACPHRTCQEELLPTTTIPAGPGPTGTPCQQRAAEHHSETMSCQPTGLVTSESQTLPGATVGSLDHPVKLSPRGGPQRGSTSKQ